MIDHLQATNQLIEKALEFNLGLYIAFVDYKKAFDSVEHKPILQTLKNQGIQNTYITLLANLYTEFKAKIQTEVEGNAFPLQRGVKQGDPLAPKLFTAVLEKHMRKLEWETKHGINIDGQRLTHLRFADDIILISSAKELETMLRDLDTVSREIELTMNTSKTKIMTNANVIPIHIRREQIEHVTDYI